MPGQVCVSPTRFLVQEAMFYEPFVDEVRRPRPRRIKVGNGMDDGVTQMGPLVQ